MRESLPPLSFPADGEQAFHRALQQAALRYLGTDHRYATARQLITAFVMTVLCAGFYWLSLIQDQRWAFVGFYFLFMMLSMLLSVMVFHDTAHNSFVRKPWANRLIGRLLVLPLGIDPDYWRARHVGFHHAYPNIELYDLDIEENGVLRQAPFQRWQKHMVFQHLYWPLVAALSLPYVAWVFDWSDRLGGSPVGKKKVLAGVSGWAVFITGKICHLTLALIIPLLVCQPAVSWATVLLIYLASKMVASLWVLFLILGTHWADAQFHQPQDTGVMPHGWYKHNLSTACDWRTSPGWLHLMVGGLNFHLTHHLFPGWNHRHYPALAELIGTLASEHGLNYRCISYRELIRQQKAFLKKMGQAPLPRESLDL